MVFNELINQETKKCFDRVFCQQFEIGELMICSCLEIERHVPVDSLHKFSSIALGSAVIFGIEAEDM